MIRLSQLIGQRVVDRDHGQSLGGIQRLLLDTERGSFTAAQLQPPVGGQAIIDWSAIVGLGDDAVIASEGQTRPPDDEREQRLVRGDLELLGKAVLTEDGTSLGELRDIELDVASGRVVRLLLEDQAIPVDRFVALGSDVLIIATPTAGSTAAPAR
ncbi:hypothetical protein BH23CHL7_BH23CHL7_01030 [soil metagenome]